MPAFLPAISRRRFLGSTLIGLTGLVTGCRTGHVEAASTDDADWVLFSDTHIATDPAFIARKVNVSANLEKAVSQVGELESRPAGVLVCGDCAYGTGQTGDYEQLTRLLEPLQKSGMHIHLALGNHDHRERFRAALAVQRNGSLDHHVTLINTRTANWLILDSLEQTNVTPGLLGEAQLAWLANTLDAHPTKPALVMIHHNPGIGGNLGLKDTIKLFEIIRPRTQVKAYIYGHTHTWSVEQDTSGIHLINLPPVAYIFRDADPSGWVTARLEPDALRLRLHSLTPGHRADGTEHTLTYRKA